LNATWTTTADLIDLFSMIVRRPIIFTEIGYLSTDGTNKDPSNYKLQNAPGRLIDLQEQANCYEAAFQAVWKKSWFFGFYWWYWQTRPDAGGTNNSDYTPQNKPAQGVVTHWYSLNRYSVTDLTKYIVWSLALVAVAAVIISVPWAKRKPKSLPKG
jgi:hypothetical protein